MTLKFERNPEEDLPLPEKCLRVNDEINLLRDRFELLSAYLDGEVTATERQQVELWLITDPATQRLYGRLINLRQGLQAMPISSAPPVEQTVKQVFTRLRKPKQTAVWVGIAAVFFGAISGILPRQSSVNQIAQIPLAAKPETLTVALSTPVIEIPKVSTSKYLKHNQSRQQVNNIY